MKVRNYNVSKMVDDVEGFGCTKGHGNEWMSRLRISKARNEELGRGRDYEDG